VFQVNELQTLHKVRESRHWIKGGDDVQVGVQCTRQIYRLSDRLIPSASDRLKFRLSVLFGAWKEGDHRDWKAIQLWAENLIPLLKG